MDVFSITIKHVLNPCKIRIPVRVFSRCFLHVFQTWESAFLNHSLAKIDSPRLELRIYTSVTEEVFCLTNKHVLNSCKVRIHVQVWLKCFSHVFLTFKNHVSNYFLTNIYFPRLELQVHTSHTEKVFSLTNKHVFNSCKVRICVHLWLKYFPHAFWTGKNHVSNHL